jgi:hypothetical protein
VENLKNIFAALFLVWIVGISPIHGSQVKTSVATSIKYIDKEMTLLDQIIENANIVVDDPDPKMRLQAKKELTKLIKNKELDEKIKDIIKDDIEIIKKSKAKRELHEARIRLLNIYAKINTQANVIDSIAQATQMVQNASPEELDVVIVQAKEIVEAAEKEEQSILSHWYTKAKQMVIAPVNYVFGEESSYTKTAFYAAVGLAVLTASIYGGYHYNESYAQAFIEYEINLANEKMSKVAKLLKDQNSRKKKSRFLASEIDFMMKDIRVIQDSLMEKGVTLNVSNRIDQLMAEQD